MIELNVGEILKATNGSLVKGGAGQTISNISIDSRTINKGDLFLALDGANHKGANFINQSLGKGAIGYIVERREARGEREEGRGQVVIEVEDSLKALQDIAAYILKKINPKVVAVTGSTGKTSVKEMLKSILSLKHKVIASQQNYNNEIGLPLTLLELEPETEIVILEMAMRGLGQISHLCRIAPPDLAVITNIGLSHMELLQNKNNIITAKAEIIEGLKPNGLVVLNGDDEATEKIIKRREARGERREVFFGTEDKADVSFSDVLLDEFARASFVLNYRSTVNGQRSTISIKLPIPGRHHVLNACAAAAIVLQLDISLVDIKNGLERLDQFSGRMQFLQANDWIIIDDSYNASPASMDAALSVLGDIQAQRKLAILGDMLELGNVSSEEHSKLGQLIVDSGANQLFTVGTLSSQTAQAAIAAGMAEQNVHSFNDCLELNKEIISYLRPGDAILIKASRALKLDKVAHFLQNKR